MSSSMVDEELGRSALIQHGILTVQCLCGMALNAGVLVLFFIMKQVRGSVYAAYMIQIAITDVLVCVTWLIYSSWLIAHVRSVNSRSSSMQQANNDTRVQQEQFSYSDEPLDVIMLIYNFHFYINIFLLAAMSVERFVAVWKSLRCQRYQFNKKFTYAVSMSMWMLAFVCILPNIVDHELGTGVSSNIKSIPENLSVHDLADDSFLREMSPEWAQLLDCFKPYADAAQYKQAHPEEEVYVEDYDGVSVENCTVFMQNLLSATFASADSGNVNQTLREWEYSVNVTETKVADEDAADDVIYPYDYVQAERTSLIVMRMARNSAELRPVAKMDEYFFAIIFTFEHLKQEAKNNPGKQLSSVCLPPYTPPAKIYNITINVAVGFFLPYMAIVCSYLGIAYMISKRAQQRMNIESGTHQPNTSVSDVVGRRMSKNINNNAMTAAVACKPQQKVEDQQISIKQQQQKPLIKSGEVKKPTQFRYGSSSLSNAQLRRISAGSASSAESFLTDQTSLQQASPNVRLSQPLFNHDKQRQQMQRAISADSGTASIVSSAAAAAGGNGNLTRNGELVFRCSTSSDENNLLKKHHPLIQEESDIQEEDEETTKLQPTGKQEQQPVATIAASSTNTNNNSNKKSSDRNRLTSEVSRTSAGDAIGGKTTAQKNAERHMKIARTVTAYVIVFSLCWLPQRIQLVVYTLEGMAGAEERVCHTISIVLRIVSFFSVLLNPIVYATTQRDIRTYIRRLAARLRKRWNKSKPDRCCHNNNNINHHKMTPAKPGGGNSNAHPQEQKPNKQQQLQQRKPDSDKFQQDRHHKHMERRMWLATRLGGGGANHKSSFVSSVAADRSTLLKSTIDEEQVPSVAVTVATNAEQRKPEATTVAAATARNSDLQKLIDIAAESSTTCCEKLNESVL